MSSKLQNFDNLSSINKKNVKVFDKQKQIMSTNTEALVFSSKHEIPFQEYTKDNFQLVDFFFSEELYKPKVKLLKYVSAEHVSSEKNQKKQFIYYAHIYVQ
ncbi:hypothetical protein [Algibacter mikhailovii]|uniref:Uncharacterized protein n=1 Tax=Algibacter mikhailovii TaxID=425498 RepID=A0A918VB76_9FLAO|nr:hypothetical protein [Algibacter mikhailovii]GGZ88117.1 hypothetical protein GCM10007028_28050 [Algibacter mikhailovii]